MEDGIKTTLVVLTFTGFGSVDEAIQVAEDQANNHLRDHKVAQIQAMTTQTIHSGSGNWLHIITICW